MVCVTVSVHYMLRFIYGKPQYSFCHLQVSVHYMLRFIPLFYLMNDRAARVSVHYMLRFIKNIATGRTNSARSFRTLYVEVYHVSDNL